MPMYEYRCGECAHVVERYVGAGGADADAGKCPKCGKGKLKKAFSTFSASCCSTGGASAGAGGCGGGSSQFS